MANNSLFSLMNWDSKARFTATAFNNGISFAIWSDQGGARPMFSILITDLGAPEFIAHEFAKIGKSSPGTSTTINYAMPRGRGSKEMDLAMSLKVEHDQKGVFNVVITDVKNNKPYPFTITMSKKLSRGNEPLSNHERSLYAFKSLVTKLENYFDKNEFGKTQTGAPGGGGGFKPQGGGNQNYSQTQQPASGSDDLFS